MYIFTPNEHKGKGWRGCVSRVQISNPKSRALNRKTFGSQDIMKRRSNNGDRVPPRDWLGKRNLRGENSEVGSCSGNERTYDLSSVQVAYWVFHFSIERVPVWNRAEVSGNAVIGKKKESSKFDWAPHWKHYVMVIGYTPNSASTLKLRCKMDLYVKYEIYTQCCIESNIYYCSLLIVLLLLLKA